MSADGESAGSMPETDVGMLWSKGMEVDAGIHAFTVDEDPQLDRFLMPWDAVGSAAHVRMLAHTGLLAGEDADRLLEALKSVYEDAVHGRIEIGPEQEDGHTALEQVLVERAGEAGRRVHLARSRNDQVALATRLYLRDRLLAIAVGITELAETFVDFAGRHGAQAMPGYTHLRRAMPSSVAQWSLAFAEGLTEELDAFEGLYRRLDRCPLGAAAGYGVPLPINREYTARLLGFQQVQRNPIDVNNSRGRHELALVQWLSSVAGILEKYLQDLALFSTEEFGFLELPEAFTTGSSIMPQKRNPDVVELARGRCRELRGLAGQIEHLAGGLPSSYHRDSQLLKAPTLRAVERAESLFAVCTRLVPAVAIREQRLQAACDDSLYAAHEASQRAAAGLPFRDAYREIADEIRNERFAPDRDDLASTHTGGVDAPGKNICRTAIATHRSWLDGIRSEHAECLTTLWIREREKENE